MNTHQRWAQKMMRNEGRPIRDIEKEAADRERRRIRRALNRRSRELEHLLGSYWTQAKRVIATATRAKKGKRK